MSTPRTKLGLAFGVVALAGVGMGFAVSAKMNLAGTQQLASAPAKPAGVVATPDARNAPKAALPPLVLPPPAAGQPAATPGTSFAGLVKATGPAVVHIGVRKFRAEGLGTGFIVSQDGYILTNEHVVGDAQMIRVRLSDRREYDAERWRTVFHQRDIDGELAIAFDEFLRAVERIDHEEAIAKDGDASRSGTLFRQHRNTCRCQHAQDHGLGSGIGLGDR